MYQRKNNSDNFVVVIRSRRPIEVEWDGLYKKRIFYGENNVGSISGRKRIDLSQWRYNTTSLFRD